MQTVLPEADPVEAEAGAFPPRLNFLRRILGMRFLVISIAIHVVLGLIAAVWVVQNYNAASESPVRS